MYFFPVEDEQTSGNETTRKLNTFGIHIHHRLIVLYPLCRPTQSREPDHIAECCLAHETSVVNNCLLTA